MELAVAKQCMTLNNKLKELTVLQWNTRKCVQCWEMNSEDPKVTDGTLATNNDEPELQNLQEMSHDACLCGVDKTLEIACLAVNKSKWS